MTANVVPRTWVGGLGPAARIVQPRAPRQIRGMARPWLPLLALWLSAPAGALGQGSAAFEAALRELDPTMVVVDGPGTLQRGDFDGDGTADVAALVTDGRRRSLVAIHGGVGGGRAHLLHARLPDGPVRLRVLAPGRQAALEARGYVDLGTDSIELVFPGRSSAIYAWDGGRYRVIPTEGYSVAD